jgi:RNA polymerase sigma-70 factor, ECF subfamily
VVSRSTKHRWSGRRIRQTRTATDLMEAPAKGVRMNDFSTMRQRGETTDTLLLVLTGGPLAEIQERLFETIYAELREMAARILRRERPDHTLQPTALVHEAYLRLIDSERVPWQGRAHFFGAAARAMRQILVDHARKRKAAKRAGQRVTLDDDLAVKHRPEIDILEIDDLLARLSNLDPRMGRVAELRVFGGLSIRELSLVLSVSERTVDGDWALAKKWIRRELSRG